MNELQITEYKNIRVLTTQQIAEAMALTQELFRITLIVIRIDM
jgi:hypothetical protein|nr:MAG TPA: hypothetical protein [Bacteriophage sp.]